MLKVNRILWPTDYSDTSNTAQIYACTLAKQLNADLHIVHVIVDPAYAASPMGMGYIPESYQDDMLERSDAELAKLPSIDCSGPTIVRKSLTGSAAESITDYAKENGVGMIIMGTHGYSGLSRLLMGSVAEKVVRTASCPVLTIHSDDKQFVDEND